MIVDLHSHYFPLEVVEELPRGPVQVAELADGRYRLSVGGGTYMLDQSLFDVEWQRADPRKRELDAWNLMPPPFTLLYELPPADGVSWSRAINNGIAASARTSPHQLIGFATVPLQDVPAAVVELRRAVRELDLKGVEIATSINGVGLDNPSLDPFWREAEELRLPIVVHPHDVSGADRMRDYHLRNLVGNPAETALAGARLLFGGVLERYPDLRIILSHGGGALPHLVGRLARGFAVRPECQARAAAPIEHMQRLYYDTVVFSDVVLRHVAEIVGDTRLVLGTDYPFDMSEEQPVALVKRSGLPAEAGQAILDAGERLVADARVNA